MTAMITGLLSVSAVVGPERVSARAPHDSCRASTLTDLSNPNSGVDAVVMHVVVDPERLE